MGNHTSGFGNMMLPVLCGVPEMVHRLALVHHVLLLGVLYDPWVYHIMRTQGGHPSKGAPPGSLCGRPMGQTVHQEEGHCLGNGWLACQPVLKAAHPETPAVHTDVDIHGTLHTHVRM